MSSNVYSPEFFRNELANSYRSAKRIVPLLLSMLPQIRSVLDVGCGSGHFLKAFADAGVHDLLGIDGDYVPMDQLVIDARQFKPLDLSRPFDLGRPFDLVISLEVAEHLPPESAAGFIDALVRHSQLVLFSAAVPHQGGTGHLNEQWPHYWAELFMHKGLLAYDLLRHQIWADNEVAWWYRQNCIVFARPETMAARPELAASAAQPAQLDRVHPALFLARVKDWQHAAADTARLRSYLSSGDLFAIEHLPDGRMNIVRK